MTESDINKRFELNRLISKLHGSTEETLPDNIKAIESRCKNWLKENK